MHENVKIPEEPEDPLPPKQQILAIPDYDAPVEDELNKSIEISNHRVSSYRTAQKYRIIGHFFPKYRTNIDIFPQNIGQNRTNMIK